MTFRAKRYLAQVGIRLPDLVAAAGRDKSTWSRLLNGKLETEPAGAREHVEALYRERANRRPPHDFWTPEPAALPETPHEPKGDQPMAIPFQPLSPAAMRQWQLQNDPFDNATMPLDRMHLPHSHRAIEQRLTLVLQNYGFAAIAGEVGCGKTTLYERARERVERTGRQPVTCIRPANIDVRKLTPVHITGEIIRALAAPNDRVPSAANERDAFVESRLQQQHLSGRRTVLVIEDAHWLSDSTLHALKGYHELRSGYSRLIGIVLLGQPELLVRFERGSYSLREVTQRIEVMELPAITGDVAGYLVARLSWAGCDPSQVFEPSAYEALESRLNTDSKPSRPQHYPLKINNVAAAAMNIAAGAGSSYVTAEEVDMVWSSSPAQLQAYSLVGVS